MNRKSVDEETRQLNDFLSKINDIALSDPDAYKYFLDRANAAQVALANLKDVNGVGREEGKVLSELGSLRFDFENYLTTGKYEGAKSFDKDIKSGVEKLKMYRIGVFVDMTKVFGSFEEVDIEKIRKLKEKWTREKGKLSETLGEDEEKKFKRRHVSFNYSEAELGLVEKAMADLFIEYQIKYARKEGILPTESFYSFTDKAHYVERFKEKLIEKIYSMEQGSPERLKLEMAFLELQSDDLITSKEVWEALVGKEILFPEKKKEEVKESNIEEPVEETALVDTSNVPSTDGFKVMLVYNGPGGAVDVRKKVKSTDENGRIRFLGFMSNKDVREIYFLEGLEKLRWTRKGNSSDGTFNYSDFENVRSIYLPKTMKEIEQGFFLGFKNLKYIYLPEGMENALDPRFIPEGVRVVENPKKDKDGKDVFTSKVDDIQEKAIITLADGYKPVKRKFGKHGGIPEKLDIGYEFSKVKEVLFTEGVETFLNYDTEIDGQDSFTYFNLKLSKFPNLTKVSLPDTLRYFDEEAFKDCKNLREVNIPPRVDQISKRCFAGCESLQSIDLKNIVGVYPYAFQGCKSLKSLDFSERLSGIQEYAFADCDGLTTVKLPPYLKGIGINAFEECDYLTKVEIPGSMSILPSGLFKNCYSLKDVTISRGIEEIRNKVFEGCGRLKRVTIPETVKKIGDCLFESSGVETVKMGKCEIVDKRTSPLALSKVKRVELPKEPFDGTLLFRYGFMFVPGVDMEVYIYDEDGNLTPVNEETRRNLLKLPEKQQDKVEERSEEEQEK